HAVEAGEAGCARGGVHDRLVVEVGQGLIAGAGAAKLWVDVFGAEQRVEAGVAAGLIGQQVGLAVVGRRAQRAAGGAVHRQADEIGEGQGGVGFKLGVFRRAGAEHLRDVEVVVLEDDVGGGDGAEVAAGAGEGHPRRGGVVPVGGEHVEGGVGRRGGQSRGGDRVGPISGGHAGMGGGGGEVVAEAVGRRDGGPGGGDDSQGGRGRRRSAW